MAGSLYNFARFDGLRPEDIAKFATERFADLVKNPTRLGERILPFVQRDDWSEDVGRLSFRPVASAIIAPDSVLPRGPLGTDSSRTYNILKGGRKYDLNESELRKLRQVFHAGARPTPAQIFNSRPYNLANALVTGYLDRAEQMRWEALSTGYYNIPGSGGQVDYGLANNHRASISGTGEWDNASTADGLSDIIGWSDILEADTGGKATQIFMSTKQMNNLLAQEATRERLAIGGLGGLGAQIAPQATQFKMEFYQDSLNGYLARHGIGPIILYDRRYNSYSELTNSQPVSTRYLHEDRVVMISATPVDGSIGFEGGTSVGYQVDGPVVENDFKPGLFVWMAEQDEPYEVYLKSVFWTLPIIGDPRTVLNARVEQ